MRGRNPDQLRLKRRDENSLRELLRDGHTSWKVARRAQTLLGRTDDEQPVGPLGEQVERDRTTIWRVCER